MSFKPTDLENSLRNLFHQMMERFNILQPRMRKLLVALMVLVMFSFMFNIIYKPQREAISRLRQKYNALKSKSAALKTQLPNLDDKRKELELLVNSTRSLDQEMARLEAQLPFQNHAHQTLGALVKFSQGLNLNFLSLKPITTKSEKDFPVLTIQMKVKANFHAIVNYLRRVQAASRFLTIEKVILEKNKDELGADLSAQIELSTFLSEHSRATDQDNFGQARLPEVITVARNPFASPMEKDQSANQLAYRLTGVIAQGKVSTAIINDEVYKIGDSLQGYQIIDIRPHEVVLRMGDEKIILNIIEE